MTHTTQSQIKTLMAQVKTISLAVGRLSMVADTLNGGSDTLIEIHNVLHELRGTGLLLDKEPLILQLRTVMEAAKSWALAAQKKQREAEQTQTVHEVEVLTSTLHAVSSRAISALLAE